MALPQPEPSEQLPKDGAAQPTLSLAGSSPLGPLPDAVWITMCAWCTRIRLSGRWVDGERALRLIELGTWNEPNLTHGICPSCFHAVTREADAVRRRARRLA